jgi:hypothetical protein
MKQRPITILVLASGLAGALAACGGDDELAAIDAASAALSRETDEVARLRAAATTQADRDRVGEQQLDITGRRAALGARLDTVRAAMQRP